MNQTSVFAEIVKTAPQEDGSLMVYGKATGSDLDLDGQRCDPAWLHQAVPEWMKIGNIREQHDAKRAVGKAIDHEVKDDGHWIKARIVDPIAVAKTKAGVFTGFSIGIKGPVVEKSVEAPNGLISGGSICEISLVDRPALPTATLTVCKAAKPGMQIKAGDFDSKRLLVRVEELVEKAVEPDVSVTLTEEQAELVEKATEPTVEKTDYAAAATDAAMNGGHGCGCCNECICDDGMSGDKAAKPAVEKAPFDRDAAKALVARLVKADDASDSGDDSGDASDLPPEYDDEQSDIVGAQTAIACISQLIISEAQEMCDNPAEDCDIALLMQAVQALRCFIHREQEQQMGANVVKKPEPAVVVLAVEAELEKAKYSADELRQMLSDGKAMKNPQGDPSYPIGDKEDLENAIHAVGRGSGDHGAIRTYIKRRAAALGASDLIPENWTSGGSSKAADTKETVVDTEIAEAAKTTEPEVEKTTEPDVAKAAVIEVDPDTLEKAIAAALDKAMPVALEKADNPLRKSLEAIIEASTRSTADQLGELGSRLERVEQMAVPGGPALRRTEVERKEARKADLLTEAARFKALAHGAEDLDLRRGYATKAAQLEAEIKALAA
jgi:hypothetical protein